MTERSLQITYRKGRPFAGYLHLPHTADGERTRSVATSDGVLVVDYNTADEPIGIEITALQNVSAERLNDVLSSLGQPALVDNEFAPLATGQDDVLVRELKSLAPDVVALLDERDAASRLLEALPTKYPTSQIGQVNPTRAWELTALWFFHRGRVHEALSLFCSELKRYANRFFELHEQDPEASKYPEDLLRQVDDRWLLDAPSPSELGAYIVNSSYVAHLLSRLGDGSGRTAPGRRR